MQVRVAAVAAVEAAQEAVAAVVWFIIAAARKVRTSLERGANNKCKRALTGDGPCSGLLLLASTQRAPPIQHGQCENVAAGT